MSNLLYKELKLSINRFFYVLPILLSLLFFIPQWIFTIAFSYFFWITVSNVCSGYIAQDDQNFCAMLPVRKKDIVVAKILAFFILELIHITSGLLMGLVHNHLYGSFNFLLDINIAFVGIILLMYAIFNLVFLPLYFKTAYFFGRPVIYAITAALIYAFIFEYGVYRFAFFSDWVEGDVNNQLIVFLVFTGVSIVLSFITVQMSIRNYTEES